MATTMTSLPPYFPAKPQSPRHTHAKVEGGVLIDQEYHRCSHLSALHDPGPHRLRRLAHNAHLKTSLRTKQRQKRQIQGQRKKKTKAKTKKTKTKRVINHPLTPELAALPRAAKGLQVIDSFLLQAKAVKAVEWVSSNIYYGLVLKEFEDSMRGSDQCNSALCLSLLSGRQDR